LSILICLIGVDGTGKTTQAKALLQQLRERGIRSKYVWLRFFHFFSIPILFLIRLRGLSNTTVSPSGRKIGYHDLHESIVLSNLYQITLFVDILIYKLFKIDIPRRIFSCNIICDRFIYDTIVDLMISTQNEQFMKKLPGILFVGLIPNDAIAFLLNAESDTLSLRRDDIMADKNLDKRIRYYQRLQDVFHINLIDAEDSQFNITNKIIEGLHDEHFI